MARYPGAVTPDRLIHYWSSPGALSRNYENRHVDNLMLMRRIERGELTARPELRARAAIRAAALEYDLAVLDVRAGRIREARARFRRAARLAPPRRRVLALGGALLPEAGYRLLGRWRWLRQAVARSREPIRSLDPPPGVERAA
jgi:hypothetical protein